MKRFVMSVAMVCMVLGATGCVGTVVTKNRFGTDRELIAVNDQVYVVDKSTGEVMTVDVSSAVPFVADSDSD